MQKCLFVLKDKWNDQKRWILARVCKESFRQVVLFPNEVNMEGKVEATFQSGVSYRQEK